MYVSGILAVQPQLKPTCVPQLRAFLSRKITTERSLKILSRWAMSWRTTSDRINLDANFDRCDHPLPNEAACLCERTGITVPTVLRTVMTLAAFRSPSRGFCLLSFFHQSSAVPVRGVPISTGRLLTRVWKDVLERV